MHSGGYPIDVSTSLYHFPEQSRCSARVILAVKSVRIGNENGLAGDFVLTQDESIMRRVGEQIDTGTVWVRT